MWFSLVSFPVFFFCVGVQEFYCPYSLFSGYEYFYSRGMASMKPSACHSSVCMAWFLGHKIFKMCQQKLHRCLPGPCSLHCIYDQGPHLSVWCREITKRTDHINDDKYLIVCVCVIVPPLGNCTIFSHTRGIPRNKSNFNFSNNNNKSFCETSQHFCDGLNTQCLTDIEMYLTWFITKYLPN